MNNKRAKLLRLEAELLMAQYVHDFVLSEDQIRGWLKEGNKIEKLYTLIPERMLLLKDKTRFQGIGTQRFFYRAVKKKPDITYAEIKAELDKIGAG